MKVYIVLEIYEDSSCIRETNILGVYSDKYNAINLIQDCINKDEYNMINKNEFNEVVNAYVEDEDWFKTEYCNGFVEWKIEEFEVRTV